MRGLDTETRLLRWKTFWRLSIRNLTHPVKSDGIDDMTKICTKCGKEFSLSEFHNDSHSRGGKRSHCRYCILAANRAWQARDPQHAKECWMRSYRKTYTPAVCHRRRLTHHGITEEQYQLLKAFNHGKCHICGGDLSIREHIDHCHKTGIIRGLLCVQCNTAIGSFEDNPIFMQRAMQYIQSGGFVDLGGIVSKESTADS